MKDLYDHLYMQSIMISPDAGSALRFIYNFID